ncbi:MAG: hypothetical protein H0X33_13425 [Taibaiella sp.]|nr:hypothetical protein [Taibaiella sp.]
MPTLNSAPAQTALERQQDITKQLEGEYQALLNEFSQMSAHYQRSGWHRGFDDYRQQKIDCNTRIIYKQADLHRSRLKEAALIKVMDRRVASRAS